MHRGFFVGGGRIPYIPPSKPERKKNGHESVSDGGKKVSPPPQPSKRVLVKQSVRNLAGNKNHADAASSVTEEDDNDEEQNTPWLWSHLLLDKLPSEEDRKKEPSEWKKITLLPSQQHNRSWRAHLRTRDNLQDYQKLPKDLKIIIKATIREKENQIKQYELYLARVRLYFFTAYYQETMGKLRSERDYLRAILALNYCRTLTSDVLITLLTHYEIDLSATDSDSKQIQMIYRLVRGWLHNPVDYEKNKNKENAKKINEARFKWVSVGGGVVGLVVSGIVCLAYPPAGFLFAKLSLGMKLLTGTGSALVGLLSAAGAYTLFEECCLSESVMVESPTISNKMSHPVASPSFSNDVTLTNGSNKVVGYLKAPPSRLSSDNSPEKRLKPTGHSRDEKILPQPADDPYTEKFNLTPPVAGSTHLQTTRVVLVDPHPPVRLDRKGQTLGF